MNSENRNKLEIWKHELKELKSGIPLQSPNADVRLYTQMPRDVQLLFDALSDVIEALTEK